MLRYLSLFSGIGAPEKALERLNIPFELVGFSEIDKYAIKSYCAIHNISPELNLGDITEINPKTLPKDIDLITHGSPCQSFSIAGKQAGGDEGSGTRSSLMWYTVEIVAEVKPKYVLWENVKNVLSKKHKPNFDKYISRMEELGYNNFYQVLNAKNYGVPQNRERIFVISIRNDIEKDFKFPEPFDNGLRLKDILEKKVDESFYVNSDKALKLIKEFKQKTNKQSINKNCLNKVENVGNVYPSNGQNGNVSSEEGISPTLSAGTGITGRGIGSCNAPKIMICGNTNPSNKGMNGNVYYELGLSPILTCNKCDAPKICVNEEVSDNEIQKIEIPEVVKVRKYNVDIKELQSLLRDAKLNKGLSINQIAEKLDMPKTLVEHWFRTDKCFSIPDAEVWYKLKDVLGIEITDFDESVTTFEEKEGVYDKSKRCYLIEGIAPTLTCSPDEKIVVRAISSPDRAVKKQNGRRIKDEDDPMFTLTTIDRHGIVEEKETVLSNNLNFVGGIGDRDIVGDDKKLSRNYPQGSRVYNADGIACSQISNGGGIGGPTGLYLTADAKRLGGLFDTEKGKHQIGSVWDKEGLSPTLDTMQGGYRQPCIMEKVKQRNNGDIVLPGNNYNERKVVHPEDGICRTIIGQGHSGNEPKVMVKVANKKGYDIAGIGDSINLQQPSSMTRRGRVGHEVAQTLDTGCYQATLVPYNTVEEILYRIRRLTPLECLRLMGFDDADYEAVKDVCSKSQIYKQAGNSIVVNVLELIFKKLFE